MSSILRGNAQEGRLLATQTSSQCVCVCVQHRLPPTSRFLNTGKYTVCRLNIQRAHLFFCFLFKPTWLACNVHIQAGWNQEWRDELMAAANAEIFSPILHTFKYRVISFFPSLNKKRGQTVDMKHLENIEGSRRTFWRSVSLLPYLTTRRSAFWSLWSSLCVCFFFFLNILPGPSYWIIIKKDD